MPKWPGMRARITPESVPRCFRNMRPHHSGIPAQVPPESAPGSGRNTQLITDGLQIRPNCVFIIPAHRDLHVLDGEFHLKPISKPRGWPDVITVCLRSLTQHWKGKIIAVIVSGYDGDGAAAMRAIKEVGGVTIAQRLDTAAQPDMPESAIASGSVDLVLSPEDIAREIVRIARMPRDEPAAS